MKMQPLNSLKIQITISGFHSRGLDTICTLLQIYAPQLIIKIANFSVSIYFKQPHSL